MVNFFQELMKRYESTNTETQKSQARRINRQIIPDL